MPHSAQNIPTLTADELDDLCRQFLDKLKTEREKKQMSTAKLSELTGIAQPNITRMETGNAKPGLAMLIRIAHALGCELSLKPKG